MIALYHAPRSRSSRIIWLLEEVAATYEIRPVSIFRPLTGQGEADPANPHPDARVPAILHEGALVTESVAIALYISDAFPEAGLGPGVGDPGRGAFLGWLAWYAAEFEPALLNSLMRELDGAPNKRRLYEQAVRRLEKALSQGAYVMGGRFSVADLLISSGIAFGRAAFPPSETLDAYVERCRARPAAVRALALDDATGLQGAA